MTPVALLPSCTQFNWKQQGKDVCVECAAVTPEERSTGVLAAGRAVLAVTGEKGTVKGGVAAGDVEVVRAFLQAGGDVNLRVPPTDGIGNRYGREEPLLLRAARWGHASICEALLAAGADASATRNTHPHAEGMRGDSMETAVANGRVDVVNEGMNEIREIDETALCK